MPLGSSISLAVSFIILLFVINEFSYNHYHKKKKQVYRVVNYYKEFKNTMSGTPYVLAKTMKDEFPQVERAINVRYLRGFKLKLEDEYFEVRRPMATDSEVFDIFTIPFIGSHCLLLSAQQFPDGSGCRTALHSRDLLFYGKVAQQFPIQGEYRMVGLCDRISDCYLGGAINCIHSLH